MCWLRVVFQCVLKIGTQLEVGRHKRTQMERIKWRSRRQHRPLLSWAGKRVKCLIVMPSSIGNYPMAYESQRGRRTQIMSGSSRLPRIPPLVYLLSTSSLLILCWDRFLWYSSKRSRLSHHLLRPLTGIICTVSFALPLLGVSVLLSKSSTLPPLCPGGSHLFFVFSKLCFCSSLFFLLYHQFQKQLKILPPNASQRPSLDSS